MRPPAMNSPKRLPLEAGPTLAGAANRSQVQPTLGVAQVRRQAKPGRPHPLEGFGTVSQRAQPGRACLERLIL